MDHVPLWTALPKKILFIYALYYTYIYLLREEQEKMNVWIAYLNLENMYGTHESLMEVFERALKHNEPLSIHQQLIGIYIHSGKLEVC